MNSVLRQDLDYILSKLSKDETTKFAGATVLITGCAGFLGFSFMHFFVQHARRLGIERLIGLDTFILGRPPWVEQLEKERPELLTVRSFDVSKDEIGAVPNANKASYIIHGASIASPTFYRRYPIVTLDANIWGLRHLLDFYKGQALKGFLFFSSSEIYGDPDDQNIPTPEEYRGNVACVGPRACYDESKRFGETMCYLFAKEYGMPITVARPFNNFGPGMRLDDRRVPADFAQCILHNKPIEILSSGRPTRTFCYVADAIAGYLKCLLHGQYDSFNIGIETPEVSVVELASIYKRAGEKLAGYAHGVNFSKSDDRDYLTHNPNRRCPTIKKARKLLKYEPEIPVDAGIERFLAFLIEEKEKGYMQ